MDVEQPTSSSSSITASCSGPAPFLLKTYDMIDDSTTDDIVSWSSSKTSFVVWNPPEFARLLLPTYFKHNNFSSFIRQLNTYGFRKIDPERWEFANEDFSKDNKHLLKNIHRRKPIHSHSQPPQQGPSSFGDAERAALEEEIERLTREKAALQSDLSRVRHQQQGAKLQVETLGQRVVDMEQRQLRLKTFVSKAVNNPCFVEYLVRMAGASMDFDAITKKRRLPKVDFCLEVVENNSVDSQIAQGSSIAGTSKPEFGATFHTDFSNKLRLELSPAVFDSLVSATRQSSNEDAGSPQRKPSEGSAIGDARTKPEGSPFAIDTLELLDTGASFALKKNGSSYRNVRTTLSPELDGSRHYSTCPDGGDGYLSCHLNLTLASSPMQVKSSDYLPGVASSLDQDKFTSTELRSVAGCNGGDLRVTAKCRNSAQMVPSNNQASAPTAGRVNDVFWEQFLTERPGSSDTEEAISSFRGNPYDEQEEGKSGVSKSWNNEQNMEQLTL